MSYKENKTKKVAQKYFAEQHKKTRRKQSSRRHFLRVLLHILIIVFFGFTAYVIFFSSYAVVTTIAVRGADRTSNATIEKYITAQLSEKYASFIPKDRTVFVRPSQIALGIKNTFPLVATVSVRMIFPDTLVVQIKERSRVFVWCKHNKNGECFILDENGIAYTKADFGALEEMHVTKVVVIDENGGAVSEGQQVIAQDAVIFFTDISDRMKRENDITLRDEIIIPSRVSGEAQLQTEEGWILYVDTTQTAEKNSITLKTFFEQHTLSQKRERLSYIDMRFPNKIFYKFQDEKETNGQMTDEQGNDEIK